MGRREMKRGYTKWKRERGEWEVGVMGGVGLNMRDC